MSRQLSIAAIVLMSVLHVACGGGSSSTTPTAPTPTPSPTPATAPPTIPNFQGEFAGSYVITSCTEAGVFFSGFCFGSFSIAGGTFALEVSFIQDQMAVSGTVRLSRGGGTPISGPFQGAIQPSGHLAGTVELPSVPFTGTPLYTRTITRWDTTITGTTLSGSFTIVYGSPTEPSTMTVEANLVEMVRQ